VRRLAPWAYAALLALGIPWYWPAEAGTILLGVPAWVLAAVAAGLLAAVLTALLLARPWPRDDSDADD
jgi:hypothetical protein